MEFYFQFGVLLLISAGRARISRWSSKNVTIESWFYVGSLADCLKHCSFDTFEDRRQRKKKIEQRSLNSAGRPLLWPPLDLYAHSGWSGAQTPQTACINSFAIRSKFHAYGTYTSLLHYPAVSWRQRRDYIVSSSLCENRSSKKWQDSQDSITLVLADFFCWHSGQKAKKPVKILIFLNI